MPTVRPWLRSPLPWLAAVLAIYLLSPIGDFLGRLATTHRVASPGAAAALAVSAETATIATALIGLFGVPLAYLLARGRSRRSALVGVAVQLPIALPPLIGGILLLYLLGPSSAIGRAFGGRLTDDRAGIVLAQMFVAAPFLIVSARSAFAAIDPSLDDVAATMGHRPLARFARVAVPAAMPGIVAGLLLAWLRGFGEFGATVVLAYHPYSLPVFTYVQFGSTGLAATMLPTAAALGTALIVLLVAATASKRPLVARGWSARRPPWPVDVVVPRTARAAPLAFDVRARAGEFEVHATAATGRCLALLGATGAGKTLTLRVLAGVQRNGSGSIRLGERDLAGTPAERRRVGYLPQESCLLPHLPVLEQVAFGVAADVGSAAYWLTRLGIDDLSSRRPDELSGGQCRRVALARALASDPDLLLLDEPFTGLDTTTRADLRQTLREVLAETRATTVLVTHDPADVAMLADDVAVLQQGRTVQRGTCTDVYARPATVDVARLLGLPNAIGMTVVRRGRVVAADGTELRADTTGLAPGAPVIAMVDPRGIRIAATARRRVTVTDVVDFAGYRAIALRLGPDLSVVAHVSRWPGAAAPAPGDVVAVAIPVSAVRLSPVQGANL